MKTATKIAILEILIIAGTLGLVLFVMRVLWGV